LIGTTLDTQTIFNAAVSLAGFMGGWILNNIYKAIERLEDDSRSTSAKYVRRDDYREDMSEVKTLLARISDKLDHKADK
jgi:hypothetical protein